jgi:hypothetical protein
MATYWDSIIHDSVANGHRELRLIRLLSADATLHRNKSQTAAILAGPFWRSQGKANLSILTV